MKLISWNVAGRGRAVPDQVAALASRSPDVVALQEVRSGTVGRWEQELAEAGLVHFRATADLVEDRWNFVAVASSYPFDDASAPIDVPMRELVLGVEIEAPAGPVELIVTHVPNAQGWKWKKVEHFEALYSYLGRQPARVPRILCGDFNSPRREFEDGTVYTWAQRETGTMRRERGARWDAAERSVILGLRAFGMVDVHRHCNGFTEEGSWAPRRAGSRARRFDHIFASQELEPVACGFVHEWRTGRPSLSDHSAIEAEFEEWK